MVATKFVLNDENDDDVVVDNNVGVSVGVGNVDDVDSICVFLAMVRWHLLPSCLYHRCNYFFGGFDCYCFCCRCHCCVVVIVVVVFVFVLVHNCCHSVA